MKKAAEKSCERKARRGTAGPVAPEPMDKEALRGEISKLVRAAAAGMVSTTIEQANDGHYQAMKYLFEMIGLFPAPVMQDAPQEDSLAGMLLNRLGMRGETSAEEPGDQRAKTKSASGEPSKINERWI